MPISTSVHLSIHSSHPSVYLRCGLPPSAVLISYGVNSDRPVRMAVKTFLAWISLISEARTGDFRPGPWVSRTGVKQTDALPDHPLVYTVHLFIIHRG